MIRIFHRESFGQSCVVQVVIRVYQYQWMDFGSDLEGRSQLYRVVGPEIMRVREQSRSLQQADRHLDDAMIPAEVAAKSAQSGTNLCCAQVSLPPTLRKRRRHLDLGDPAQVELMAARRFVQVLNPRRAGFLDVAFDRRARVEEVGGHLNADRG